MSERDRGSDAGRAEERATLGHEAGGSGVRSATVGRALREAVAACEGSSPERADEIVGAALALGTGVIPERAATLRAWIGGALEAAIESRLGSAAAEQVRARMAPVLAVLEAQERPAASSSRARAGAGAPGADAPAVVYVLADRPALAARVRMTLGERAEVIRARSMEDVLRASTLRVGWRSALLVDLRPASAVPMPLETTVARVLARMPALVWGERAEIDELGRRGEGAERVLGCASALRPEDVVLLLELLIASD